MVLVNGAVISASNSKFYLKYTTIPFPDETTATDVIARFVSKASAKLRVEEILVQYSNEGHASFSALDPESTNLITVLDLKKDFSQKTLLTLKIRAEEYTLDNEDASSGKGSHEDGGTGSTSGTGSSCDVTPWWQQRRSLPTQKTRVTMADAKSIYGAELCSNETFEKIHVLSNSLKTNCKSLLYDCLLLHFREIVHGVRGCDVSDFDSLVVVMQECLWYIGPHQKTLSDRGCCIPQQLLSFCGFNNPKYSAHSAKNLSHVILQEHVGKLSDSLEKSYAHHPSFSALYSVGEALVESLVKYTDYLEERVNSISENHQSDDQFTDTNICVLKLIDNRHTVFSQREMDILDSIHDRVTMKSDGFYDPVGISDILPARRYQRYKFLKKMRSAGFSVDGYVVYTLCLSGNQGYIHYMWREDMSENENARINSRQKAINVVDLAAPKFFSRAHKKRCRDLLDLLMQDKLSPAEFRVVYRTLTGDESISENKIQKEIDSRYREILASTDESILRDLRKNNGRPPKFDPFWIICQQKLESLTTIDDRRHGTQTGDNDIVTHLAKAISAKDLYDQCVASAHVAGLSNDDVPSFSWFRFQFWPKSEYQKTALHYTGRLNVRYMVQRRQLRKEHPDQHYCRALFKYAKHFALLNRENVSFVCTDDKHKISVGEPNCPIAAVERGRRVLVGLNETMTVMDHDFSNLSIIPTVVLINSLPETVDGSFYRGKPHIILKLTATQSSTAIRNAKEVANALENNYGGKDKVPPVLILYTDGGPEHRTNYLSVKIALIALARYLNLDMVVAVRTAPGHSFLNPAEKINCILNLGLYGTGMMRQRSRDEIFEKKLSSCGNLSEVRGLVDRTLDGKSLLEDTVQAPLMLLSSTFSRLKLKEQSFNILSPAGAEEINNLLQEALLDKEISRNDNMSDLPNRPMLQKVLNHNCKQRTYFFSYKKCREAGTSCSACEKPRLSQIEFDSLQHLPDPIPAADNEDGHFHYAPFSDIYGTETKESLPSAQLKAVAKGAPPPFNVTIQHVKNVSFTLTCSECDKPRVVFSKHKVSNVERRGIIRLVADKLYICGASMSEFKDTGISVNTAQQELLNTVYVKENLNCATPVEILYYSAAYPPVCCHCGTKRKLTEPTNAYSICTLCLRQKKQPVLKRKRKQMIANK